MFVTDIPIWSDCPAVLRDLVPAYMEIRHDRNAEGWKTGRVIIWDPTQFRHVDLSRDRFHLENIRVAVNNLEGLRGVALMPNG